MSTPVISVLMSVYNGEAFLGRAIESVLAQRFRDFEFLIVNDGSGPAALSILKEYRRKDDRIRILDKPNSGLTKSLNHGLSEVRGAWVARQDADDESDPDRLSEQLDYMKSSGAGAAGCGSRLMDANGRLLMELPILDEARLRERLRRSNCMGHGTLFFPAELLKAERYHEYFRFAQDFELLNRLNAKVRVGMVPAYLYSLREHGASISASRLVEQCAYAVVARHRDRFPILDGIPPLDLIERVGDPETYVSLAELLFRKGRFPEAAGFFARAGAGGVKPFLSRRPALARPLYRLARGMRKLV